MPADPRRDPDEAPAPADWREMAIALGTANLVITADLPRIREQLGRIELAVAALHLPSPPAPAPEPPRERLISQHDAEELVAAATKSERVKEVVRRYSLEQTGRVVLWAAAIVAGSLLLAGVGWALHDCTHASLSAPAHP